MRAKQKWIILFLGGLTIFFGYLAWGLFTKSFQIPLCEFFGAVFTIVTIAFYNCAYVYCVKSFSDKNIIEQLYVISFIGTVITLLLIYANGFALLQQKQIIYLVTEGLWFLTFSGSLLYTVYIHKKRICRFHPFIYLKKQRGILFLFIITAFFMVDVDAVQFKWDGLLYYLTGKNLDISSLSSLAVYGHIAQTYGMLVGLGNIIAGNTTAVMIGLNIGLMAISVVSFYALMKTLIPEKAEWEYVLMTAIYAWSPFLLGMVYYHSLDFYCQCLFTPMIYCLYKKKWIYFSVFSFLFCFTKEPAIIIYGAVCAGIVIWDFLNDKASSTIMRMKKMFSRQRYYLMALPGVFWLITYVILGPWSAGSGGVALDFEYILSKLKNLYILNFNWIFSLLTIVGLVYMIKTKNKNLLEMLFPIWCCQLAFTAFSCIFKTINHPRYNDTNQITLYVLAVIPLFYYFGDFVKQLLSVIIIFLLLISNFFTIDPVSRLCYPKVNVGSHIMIATSSVPLGDGMIYNRQMLGVEGILNMALRDILPDDNCVLFTAIDNNAYYFDGMARVEEINEAFRIDQEFWNLVENRRETDNGEQMHIFEVFQLTDKADWSILEKHLHGKVNYVYLPTVEDQHVKEIEERYPVLERQEYQYKGWKLKRICFEISGSICE